MNASPFGVCVRSPILAPYTLMVLELVDVAIDLKGAFLGLLSAVTRVELRGIIGLHDSESSSTEGLPVCPIRVLIQIIAHKAMTDADIFEAMGASMKAWQEPMHAAAKVAAVICPRYRVNRLQLIRIEVGAPEGLQRFIRVSPTNN